MELRLVPEERRPLSYFYWKHAERADRPTRHQWVLKVCSHDLGTSSTSNSTGSPNSTKSCAMRHSDAFLNFDGVTLERTFAMTACRPYARKRLVGGRRESV